MEEQQIQQPVQVAPVIMREPVKKSKWWLWLIIALVVVGAGTGIWFLLSSVGVGGIGGSSIPSPPALPN